MGSVAVTADADECRRAFERLTQFGTILAIKLFRIALDPPPPVPVIPCLDHEAMLHQIAAPHGATYLQETGSRDLHEIVFIPRRRRIEIDTVSTWGEASPASRERLHAFLTGTFPAYRVTAIGPSRFRGDRRVAEACRAQVTLRDVLLGTRTDAVHADIDRLQTIGALMEKQSRVASWAVRTVTAPMLAAAGVITYQILGLFTERIGATGVGVLRYAVLGLLGAVFLYYGLKAVHLTEMSNRVWKRAAEYGLILEERSRLGRV